MTTIILCLLPALAIMAVCGMLRAMERDQPRAVWLFLTVLIAIAIIANVIPVSARPAGVLP